MKKIKIIATILILLLLFIVIPTGFAMDNETVLAIDDTSDILTADYYFDANTDNDTGNGSIDNPYKNLTPSRIQANSILHLKDGEYDLSDAANINNVTIIGQNPQSTIIKNARFTVNTKFYLYNVTLINSAISNNDQFNASNTIFKDSTNAIYSKKNMNFNNCTFSNNTAELGGVIYIKDGILNINNSLFADNTASLFGGAVTSIASTVTINNVTFRNNKAQYYGGAIYSLYGNLTLTNSIFNKNNAKEGGALFVDDLNPCIIENNKFTNNNATFAGAIYSISNNMSSSILDNNQFENNTAILENNALETTVPNMTISNGDYLLVYYTPTFNGTIPTSYDLRDYNQVTPVKDQGSGGNCWAFATSAALESCILKANGLTYDLSEENMKNLMAKYSDYGWKMETNNGGYDDMGVGYLVSWLGPVNESDDEYNPSSLISPVLNSFYHIQNVVYLTRNSPTDNDAIKRAIMEYGGVATSIYWLNSYNKNGNYYYNGNNGANHAVTIIGWDDNYSKSNFNNNPAGDGAWIIKNSWGTGRGKEGFFYVSYYDTKCAQVGRDDITYTFILNDTIKYDKNYQYDIPGKTDVFVNSSSTVWYKNVFNATDNEYLAAVSTYFQKLTNYTVSIYVNNVLKHTQNGTSDMGYYTINLNQFIPLNIGDIFEVVFKITVDGEAAFPISEKVSLNKLFYHENISFLSYDGVKWTDLFNLTWAYSTHTYNSQVACIKAFTVFDALNTTTSLTVNTTDVVRIKVEVLNQYYRPVTGGNVTLDINGETVVVPVVNGVAFVELCDVPKTYTVRAVYENNGYISSNDTFTFETSLINVTVDLTVSDIDNPVNITAKVTNQYGYVVNMGTIIFKVEGKDYYVDVVNGTACLTHVFKTFGNQNVVATFNEIDYYNSSSVEKSFNVDLINTIISIEVLNEYNPINIKVTVIDQYDNPVDYGNVTFRLDNSNVTVDVVDGVVSLNHIFENIGLNSISVYYDGGYYYNSSIKGYDFISVSSIVAGDDTKTYNSYYQFKLLDEYGNPLKNTSVNVTISSKTYSLSTDEDGVAKLNIVLAPGSYVISIVNPINNEVKTQNVKVVNRITENKYLEMYYGAGKYYKVKVFDDNGNVAKGVNVKFIINGKSYTRTTDSNGYASFKISLKPGNYKITGEYKGFIVSNNVKVKSTIVTKNVNVKNGKTIKFKAKLLNKNGKILKNKKIKFKFKGKTYKVKTNKKGKAILKITKKYKKGTYTIKSTYGKLTVKNKIKIK